MLGCYFNICHNKKALCSSVRAPQLPEPGGDCQRLEETEGHLHFTSTKLIGHLKCWAWLPVSTNGHGSGP